MSRASSGTPPAPRLEVGVVALLVALALGLRALRWQRTAVLFNDGPEFLRIAQAMARGDWSEALSHPFHPLYSLFTAAVHPLIGDWEAAAATVSVLAGGASVVFLYLFLRSAFGWPVAPIGAALLAVHYRAVSYASDVQSDGLYLAFFLAALWLAWTGLAARSGGRAFGAGAAAGLAYLTRPEGLGVALVAGLFGAARTARGSWRIGSATAWGAALGAGVLVFVLPYALALRAETGAWQLTQKKSVTQLLGVSELTDAVESSRASAPEPGSRPPAAAADESVPVASRAAAALAPAAGAVAEVLDTAPGAARYEILVLLGVGLIAVRGRPGQRGSFLLALVALYALVLFALALHHGYVSRRHLLPVMAASFGYAALGVLMLGKGLMLAADRIRALPRLSPRAATGSVLALACVVALGSQLEPRREEDLAGRRAAEWLRGRSEEGGPVAAKRSRLAYYASAPFIPLSKVSRSDPVTDLRARGARYVILDEETRRKLPLTELPGVRVIHRVSAAGHEAWVVELLAEPRSVASPGQG